MKCYGKCRHKFLDPGLGLSVSSGKMEPYNLNSLKLLVARDAARQQRLDGWSLLFPNSRPKNIGEANEWGQGNGGLIGDEGVVNPSKHVGRPSDWGDYFAP